MISPSIRKKIQRLPDVITVISNSLERGITLNFTLLNKLYFPSPENVLVRVLKKLSLIFENKKVSQTHRRRTPAEKSKDER